MVSVGMVTPPSSSPPPQGTAVGDARVVLRMRFRAFEAMVDGVVVIDDGFVVRFVNSQARAMLGSDFVDMKCSDSPLGDGTFCPTCPMKEGTWDFEKGHHVRTLKGVNGRQLEAVTTLLVDKGEKFLLCVLHDVTDKASEARAKMLADSFEQMGEAVCVADLEGRLLHVNRAFTRLTGYDEKGVSGLSMMESGTASSDVGTMKTILKAAIAKEWHG